MDKGGYGRECEIRYKVGKMADNLPLDYSCPHPSLDDSDLHLLRPPSWSMYRVIDVLLLHDQRGDAERARKSVQRPPLSRACSSLAAAFLSRGKTAGVGRVREGNAGRQAHERA